MTRAGRKTKRHKRLSISVLEGKTVVDFYRERLSTAAGFKPSEPPWDENDELRFQKTFGRPSPHTPITGATWNT
jgi:hypothetical protein